MLAEVGHPRAPEQLNAKQAAFVLAYLKTGNGKRSAITAGYSPRSAESIASDLLRNPKVAAALGAKVAKVTAEAESTASEVVTELRRVGMVDPADLVDPSTRCVLQLHEMPEAARRAIASFEVEELLDAEGKPRGRLVKVKFWNKVQANEVLAKKHGLLVDKHEVELGERTLAAVLAAARARKGAA
jgi:phage terminase small subunit